MTIKLSQVLLIMYEIIAKLNENRGLLSADEETRKKLYVKVEKHLMAVAEKLI